MLVRHILSTRIKGYLNLINEKEKKVKEKKRKENISYGKFMIYLFFN